MPDDHGVAPTCLRRKVSSTEVGYAYDNVWATLKEAQLSEGLRSIPTFGEIILWPTRNTEVDLSCQCNSRDAIVIQLECDFLFVPITEKTLVLTHTYKNWEEYLKVVTLSARSSVRNSSGVSSTTPRSIHAPAVPASNIRVKRANSRSLQIGAGTSRRSSFRRGATRCSAT